MKRALISIFVFACASTPAFAATITVDTTVDELDTNGTCSLREAVSAANSDTAVDGCVAGSGADTIVIPAGTYALTLTGADEDGNATGDLDITGPVTLQGDSAATTAIDGNGTDRVLQVLGASVAVTLSGLTVRNGRPPDATTTVGENGGGILSEGPLTLVDVTFSGNVAGRGADAFPSGTLGGSGGGVFVGGDLTVTRCRFLANVAGRGGDPTGGGTIAGGGGAGGAIAGSGTWTITGSTFALNTSGSRGTGNGPGGGQGGAIRQTAGALTVDATTFSDNATQGAAVGGALSLSGTTQVTGCTFAGNQSVLGSAIYIIANSGSSAVASSTFVGNSSSGGAIDMGGSITFDIYGSTFAYNLGGALDVAGANTTVRLRDAIVVGNRNGQDTGDLDCTGPGTVLSKGYNVLVAGTGCIGDQTGDQVLPAGVAAAVVADSLTSLGGPTQVLALPPGSPAIGAGTCTDVSGTAVAVDQRGAARVSPCDVGAVQMNANPGVALMNVTAEPAGSNCAEGGQRIDVGIDTDGDGVLEASEVTSTRYVCNGATGATGPAGDTGPAGSDGADGATGADGQPGASALVATTALASGDAHCAAGGTRVDMGTDANGNGALDSGEVQSTAYVCNGADGAAGANGPKGADGGCGSMPGPAGGSAAVELLLGAALLLGRRRSA